jgi:Xaa-Pro dipeptidase
MDDRHERRVAALFDRLPDEVGVALVPPSETLFYLSGLSMERSERPALLALFRDGPPAMVLPRLEADRARDALGDVTLYAYGDATDPVAAAAGAFAELRAERELPPPIAAEFRATRLLEYELLADDYGWADLHDLEPAATALRARKDDAEIGTMREAASMTDNLLEATLAELEPGLCEVDVERRLRKRVIDSEADEFGVGIVTAGERTARAHANTGETEIESGDPVMIDVGVVHDGYYSDITRTVAVGDPDPEFREIYGVVREAARAGREAVAPGETFESADRAAREVVESAGYGEQFPHRLGHGLGLEGHEPPYLVEGNDDAFAVGNVVTVEPGVYVDGLGGVRIEDDVLVTEDGRESLTSTPRELRVL